MKNSEYACKNYFVFSSNTFVLEILHPSMRMISLFSQLKYHFFINAYEIENLTLRIKHSVWKCVSSRSVVQGNRRYTLLLNFSYFFSKCFGLHSALEHVIDLCCDGVWLYNFFKKLTSLSVRTNKNRIYCAYVPFSFIHVTININGLMFVVAKFSTHPRNIIFEIKAYLLGGASKFRFRRNNLKEWEKQNVSFK